jgi:hypothetical protein
VPVDGLLDGADGSAKQDDANDNLRTGHAPRSQLDLAETKKLESARAKKDKAKPAAGAGKSKAKPKHAKAKKLSAIDAAAQVLAGSNEPMTCKELIAAMADQGLWTSPGGATPHATLYSAILREVAKKGKAARFKKTDRGRFTANA